MNQYEKQHALDWIDGYWSPRPGASEKTLFEDFERAKQEYRDAVAKNVSNVNSISLDEFRNFKGACFPKVVR